MNNATLIPLTALEVSPFNVRKTGGTSVGDLAASIRHVGLLHNLVVRSGVGGRYEVVDGSRRLKALKSLVADGHLPKDYEAPCAIVASNTDTGAAEASLAANTLREAMHPADACDAFRDLIENQGQSLTDVAAHFGVTELFVKQRLKLAKVSPKIIAAFREGKLDLQDVEAYAISNDVARQERVFKQIGDRDNGPEYIRRLLTQGEIPSDDPRVRFVTLDAYEQAGGAVRRDLFDPENGGYVADEKLLDRLLQEKLASEAEKIRAEGFAWVEAGADISHWHYPSTTAKDPSRGAIVRLSGRGEIEVHRNLLKPGQRSKSGATAKAGKNGKAKPAKPELSAAYEQRLTHHYTLALQHQVATHPELAARLLLARLVSDVLLSRGYGASAANIKAENEFARLDLAVRAGEKDLTASPAWAALQGAIDAWRKKGLPKSHEQVWPWIQTLGAAAMTELFTLVVGLTITGRLKRDAAAAAIAAEVKLNMADYWQPTPDSFFGAVPKGIVLEAIADVAGKAKAATLESSKRDAVAAEGAKVLAGRGWLPKPLRGPGYVLKPAEAAVAAAKEPPGKRPGSNPPPPKGKKPAPPPNPPKAKTAKRAAPKKAATKKPTKKAAK